MGDRLATVDMGRQWEGCCAPCRVWGWAGAPSNTQCRLGRGLLRTRWYPDPSNLDKEERLDNRQQFIAHLQHSITKGNFVTNILP